MTPIVGAVVCPRFAGRRLARCSGAELSVDARALLAGDAFDLVKERVLSCGGEVVSGTR